MKKRSVILLVIGIGIFFANWIYAPAAERWDLRELGPDFSHQVRTIGGLAFVLVGITLLVCDLLDYYWRPRP
jgi:hypothetical protein